tara:strand:+ start:65 stop:838 length:774 start_codon:yes stop_codon:yes gene_type:complete
MSNLIYEKNIFVQYPYGAGGWFLSSLLHYAMYPREPLKFNALGSGHSNSNADQTNNFHKDILYTPEFNLIINDTGFDQFSYDDRIKFLQNNIKGIQERHVFAFHAKNINIFLDAFPNSKCIQINIEDYEIKHCLANFLYKLVNDTNSIESLATHYNQNVEIAKLNLQNLLNSKEAIDYFDWASPVIQSTRNEAENELRYDNRILELMFNDYMKSNIEHLLRSLLNFAEITYDTTLFNTLTNNITTYRQGQPTFNIDS